MIELNNEAKAAVFNAVLEAEMDYIYVIRENAIREEDSGYLKAKHIMKELHYKEIYAAQYRLCARLGLREQYNDWRGGPIEFDELDLRGS